MRRHPLKSPPRRLLHVVANLAGWMLFAYLWFRVILYYTWDTRTLVAVLILFSVGIPFVTLYWVLHNVRIFKVKGPRTGVPAIEEKYDSDWQGTPVIANWPAMREARGISVDIQHGAKMFRALPQADRQ